MAAQADKDGSSPSWIKVEATVKAPLSQVWSAWTSEDDITQWNAASDDWCCPSASCDLKVGGKFTYRLEAKDKSVGFDLTGKFTAVDEKRLIEFELEDGRKVRVEFNEGGDGTTVAEGFEADRAHSLEQQQSGWQSILNNFKTFVEAKHSKS